MKYATQYALNGKTVWVHCSTGETVGRFDVMFGMDVHHTIEEQAKNGGIQCLDCTHERPGMVEFERFCAHALREWGVRINRRRVDMKTLKAKPIRTPMLDKLREYLSTASREEIQKDWEAVKSLGYKGGLTAKQFMKGWGKRKVACPMCLNSSGVKAYSGRVGEGQKCEDCEGRGTITMSKYKSLVKKYGDLVGDTHFV